MTGDNIKVEETEPGAGITPPPKVRVTSANYDGVTQNSTYFFADGIHPNVEGHERIYRRALLDVPFLFV